MNYLIDTNTITALANRHPGAWDRLESLSPESVIASCFVVVGEWEYGIRNAPGRARQEAIRSAGEQAFAALDAEWQTTPEVSSLYGILQARLRSRGHKIPVNDAWIAAVALANNAAVVTTDPHFHRVEGLDVEDWTV